MNEDINKKLASFMDTDGKIILTDDMPSDLKAAINYLNENNVNLFTNINEDEFEDTAEDELREEIADNDSIDSDVVDDLDEDEAESYGMEMT